MARIVVHLIAGRAWTWCNLATSQRQVTREPEQMTCGNCRRAWLAARGTD